MAIENIRDRENNGLAEDLYRTLDFIMIDELREFALTSIERYGTIEKLEEANKVSDVIRGLLTHKRLLDGQTHQSFVDVMLSAALVHNLFYDESDWLTLFQARKILSPIASELKINEQALDALYHTVEGQLGEQTPISEIIPKPGTPTELFAYAVWFVKNKDLI
jgi:hypothetical protein